MTRLALSRLFSIACIMAASPSLAAVSQEEAERLKTGNLTPLGAERAGNADGTIPAWDGSATPVPAAFDARKRRSDLFPEDKPLFAITSANMEQYADKISEGQTALLKKYPEYRLDVYRTRRTAVAPQWVYDRTYQNALEAQPVDDGLRFENAYGGIPFPIPSTAREAMWNHLLRWQGVSFEMRPSIYYVTGGQLILAAAQERTSQYPIYDIEGNAKSAVNYDNYRVILNGPPIRAGEQILVVNPVDQVSVRTQAWVYVTGQRRVRKLATAGYDTPTPNSAGLFNADETAGYGGPMDRYDWKLVGKREMYVPYNSNKLLEPSAIDQVLTKTTINPDLVRWELHRVWEIEANLRPGSRHTKPRRKFFLDEDTWAVIVADSWDSKGVLWNTVLSIPIIFPDLPGTFPLTFPIYDLIKGEYIVGAVVNESDEQLVFIKPKPESFFTPAALAGEGLR